MRSSTKPVFSYSRNHGFCNWIQKIPGYLMFQLQIPLKMLLWLKPKTGLTENTKLSVFSHLVHAMETCVWFWVHYMLILNPAVSCNNYSRVLSILLVYVAVSWPFKENCLFCSARHSFLLRVKRQFSWHTNGSQWLF